MNDEARDRVALLGVFARIVGILGSAGISVDGGESYVDRAFQEQGTEIHRGLMYLRWGFREHGNAIVVALSTTSQGDSAFHRETILDGEYITMTYSRMGDEWLWIVFDDLIRLRCLFRVEDDVFQAPSTEQGFALVAEIARIFDGLENDHRFRRDDDNRGG